MLSITSLSTIEAEIVNRAAQLLKVTIFSMNDQLTIEHEIDFISPHRNCTRPCAAQLLNEMAFPENR